MTGSPGALEAALQLVRAVEKKGVPRAPLAATTDQESQLAGSEGELGLKMAAKLSNWATG